MFYSMKKRIKALIKELGMSQLDFAESIGTTATYLSQGLTMEKRSFGVDFILRIKQVYPQVDLNWLIAGVGEMFLAGKKSQVGLGECPHCRDMTKTVESLRNSLTVALETIERIKGNR